MDPEQNLREQRELIAKILNGDATTDDIENLAALAKSLDDWRLAGGFDPYIKDTSAPFRLQLNIDDGTDEGQWLTFFTGRTSIGDSHMAMATASAAALAQAQQEEGS